MSLRIVSGLRSVLAASVLAALIPGGCAKKSTGGAASPGDTKEDVAARLEQAKKHAVAQGLVEIANQNLQKGRYMSALKEAEKALQDDPRNADAFSVIGAAKWRAGDFEGSLAAFRKALEINDKHYGASIGAGRCLQAQGHHREALEIQDRVLQVEKDQVDPRLVKLWSLYALADFDQAVKVLDEIFQKMPAEDPQLALVQAYAEFARALEGKGPFFEIVGATGKSDVQLDMTGGVKHSGGMVGGKFGRIVLLELQDEAKIDVAVAKQLGLKEIKRFKPMGSAEEVGIVVVPEVKFGDLVIKNVPAFSTSLENFGAGIGETPAMVLGRQAMHRLGAITFDFPARSLEIVAKPPTAAPAGAVEIPLLLVSMHVVHAPAVPVSVDGSEHKFWAYLGGTYGTGVSVTKKAYLKSGHLPREVEPPDDATQGLKMVFVEKVGLGSISVPGVGGLVLTNTPPDQNLGQFIEGTSFELGGYVNLPLLQMLRTTYVLSEGKIYLANAG